MMESGVRIFPATEKYADVLVSLLNLVLLLAIDVQTARKSLTKRPNKKAYVGVYTW